METSAVPSCAICGTFKDLEIHHLKPLAKGGEDVPENIVYLCQEHHQGLGLHQGIPRRRGRELKGPAASFYLGAYVAFWKRFKALCARDGTSASKKITEFIVTYVTEHEPGNPQRPLEAFVPGHPAAAQSIWSTMLKELLARAEHLGGDLSYNEVLEVFKDQAVKGPLLPSRAKSMAKGLEKLGVKIWY